MIPLFLAMLGQAAEVGIPLDRIPAYQAALEDSSKTTATDVTFLDLWETPDRFRGTNVEFTGRVVRVFEAPASGQLPARFEIWLSTDENNLVCVVVPDRKIAPHLGDREGFIGQSLGIISYRGGDGVRRAPLIVGSKLGRKIETPVASASGKELGFETGMAVVLAMIVMGMIARVTLRRPTRRRVAREDLPLEFLDASAPEFEEHRDGR